MTSAPLNERQDFDLDKDLEMTRAVETARALLDEYWDFNIPIVPEDFARRLGLKVERIEGLGTKSGYLDAENRKICVNSSDVPERQRFTIAHELGHFCLEHGSSLRDTTMTNWFLVNPVHERLANEFAAELLMPAIAIKAMIEVRKIKDPVALREAFGVSSQALFFRLKNLGYIL
jgi:Zn-dependent peptidase ImmA (M78 family)